MTTVTIITKPNPDGTITYTVKCGLEEVYDIYGDVIDNPIQTLYWSEEKQRYVLYLDPPQENSNANANVNANANANSNANAGVPGYSTMATECSITDTTTTSTSTTIPPRFWTLPKIPSFVPLTPTPMTA